MNSFSFLTSRVAQYVKALQAHGIRDEMIVALTRAKFLPLIKEYVENAVLSPNAGVSCRLVYPIGGQEDCPSTYYRYAAECLFSPAYEATKWYRELKVRSELDPNPLQALWLHLVEWVQSFLEAQIVNEAVRLAFERSAASILYSSSHFVAASVITLPWPPDAPQLPPLSQRVWVPPHCPSDCPKEYYRHLVAEVTQTYLQGTIDEMRQEEDNITAALSMPPGHKDKGRIYARDYSDSSGVQRMVRRKVWTGKNDPANFTGELTLELFCLELGDYAAPPSDGGRRRTRGSTQVVVETKRPGCDTPPGYLKVCVHMFRPETMAVETWREKSREERRRLDALRLAVQEMRDAKHDPDVLAELSCLDPWCTFEWDPTGATDDGGETGRNSYRLCITHVCYCVGAYFVVRAPSRPVTAGAGAPTSVRSGRGDWQAEWDIRKAHGLDASVGAVVSSE